MIKKIEWSLFLDAEKTDFPKLAGLFKKALNLSEQDHSFIFNVNGVNVKVSDVRFSLRQTASYNKIGFAANTSLLAKDSYFINEHMEKIIELVEAGMPEITRLKKSMTLFMDDELMDKKEFIHQPVLAKASVKEKAKEQLKKLKTSDILLPASFILTAAGIGVFCFTNCILAAEILCAAGLLLASASYIYVYEGK